MFGVENLVPERVQLVHIVVIFERKEVAAFVTRRISLVIFVFTVQWLHNIPHVVNQKAKRIRLGTLFITWVQTIRNVVVQVRVTIGVPVFLTQPVYDVLDAYGQIATFTFKFIV